MAGDVIHFGIKMNFDGRAVEGGISITRDQFRQLANDAKRSSDAVSGGFTSAAKGVRSVSDMLAQGRNAVGGYLGLRELARASDEWTNLRSRINLVSPSASAAASAMTQVLAVAQQTGQSLATIGDVYQKIARNALQYNLTQGQSIQITQAIANAVKLSGASAESASGALLQFGQAIASGELRGEELNSVLEQTPVLAEAIARGMGRTIGDLRKMGEAGQLAARDVLGAIAKESARLEQEASGMSRTISQSITQLDNAFKAWVGESQSGSAAVAADGIGLMARNFNLLADVASAVVTTFGVFKLTTWVTQAAAGASAAGGLGAAIAGLHPAVRIATIAVGALTAAMTAFNALSGNRTPLESMADHAKRTAAELAKVAAEIRNVSHETAQSALKNADSERSDINKRIKALADRNDYLQRSGDGNLPAVGKNQDEILLLAKRRQELDASVKTLTAALPDAGLRDAEKFSKNPKFLTETGKRQLALDEAGTAYRDAWLATAARPPEVQEAERKALKEQYQGYIAETLKKKGGTRSGLPDDAPDFDPSSMAREFEQAVRQSDDLLSDLRRTAAKALDPLAAADVEFAERFGKRIEEARAKGVASIDDLNKAEAAGRKAIADKAAEEASAPRRALERDYRKEAEARQRAQAAETMTESQRQLADALAAVDDRARAAEEALKKQFPEGTREAQAYKDELAKIDAAHADAARSARAAATQQDALNASWEHGAAVAMRNYLDQVKNVARQSEQAFSRSFQRMEDALTNFVTTGKFDFKSLIDSMIAELARFAVQQQVIKPLLEGMSGGSSDGGIASFLGNAVRDRFVPTFGFAHGGVPGGSDLHQYSNSILTSPTLFRFAKGASIGQAGEAGPEAIMPLSRGPSGDLGVRLFGANAGASGIQVQIFDQRSAATASPVQTEIGTGPDGMNQLRVFIKDEVNSQIATGRHDAVMRGRYGVGPRVMSRG